jgi:hypothetical protein
MSVLRFLALLSVLLLAACGGNETTRSVDGAPDDSATGDYYTAANIWYEHPMRIYSINYHVGTVLHVGTKCHVSSVSRKAIDFETTDGKEFRMLIPGHGHQSHTDMRELFKYYFSKKNEMGPGGKFEHFTKMEQQAVRGAVIMRGMRKEAVLMAYGYPPSDRTVSLDSNIWVYFHARFVTHAVDFENGRTVNTIY